MNKDWIWLKLRETTCSLRCYRYWQVIRKGTGHAHWLTLVSTIINKLGIVFHQEWLETSKWAHKLEKCLPSPQIKWAEGCFPHWLPYSFKLFWIQHYRPLLAIKMKLMHWFYISEVFIKVYGTETGIRCHISIPKTAKLELCINQHLNLFVDIYYISHWYKNCARQSELSENFLAM